MSVSVDWLVGSVVDGSHGGGHVGGQDGGVHGVVTAEPEISTDGGQHNADSAPHNGDRLEQNAIGGRGCAEEKLKGKSCKQQPIS